ncbi:hypothetical protein ACOTTU_00505 [Roseobacter sp. EG26]|uniref:hypothetical protein n=1 Tax=Roseobacter sp. EG26 TaxID=3412477 RepID=UPI003CE51A69
MRHVFAPLTALCLWAGMLAAQEDDAPSMMERGAQQFLEGLLLEMEPALEGMRGFIDEMGPALTKLMGEIEDWSVYEAPEILPNGDIIIRRKPDERPDAEVSPQIEL